MTGQTTHVRVLRNVMSRVGCADVKLGRERKNYDFLHPSLKRVVADKIIRVF